MAIKGKDERRRVVKKTCQNGGKSSTANKSRKHTKPSRGQG